MKRCKGENSSGNKGFSLIETIVSVTIFSALVITAGQIFATALEGQSRSRAAQNVEESLRFALEVMSKEIRGAQPKIEETGLNPQDCTPVGGADNDGDNIYSALDNSDNPNSLPGPGNQRIGVGEGDRLAFRNKNSHCVKYYLDTTNDQVMIIRNDGSNPPAKPITPGSVEITNLKFIVDDDRVIGDNATPVKQSSVTILIEGSATVGRQTQNMRIQTTISARTYE